MADSVVLELTTPIAVYEDRRGLRWHLTWRDRKTLKSAPDRIEDIERYDAVPIDEEGNHDPLRPTVLLNTLIGPSDIAAATQKDPHLSDSFASLSYPW